MFNWFSQKTNKSSPEPAHQSESTGATAQGRAQTYKPEAADAESTPYAFQRVQHVILVASGKGGVGKSTTAVNLATALAAEGAKTGLLDADIYGPSIPMMLGLTHSQAASGDGKTMQPQQAAGLSVQSIGFLVSP
ncbi:MAG: Mrp/NBP35 family ATP-binding protein, partial [Alkalimonas sp.]|nr:Mrp/NBP35 family ATP-binding protein [Alkalimonas sp.]